MANKNLSQAKKAKNDEFYTQLTDIEKELAHYRKHFKGKVVLCNCDDPFESNFFKYFVLNFNRLGLKKLIATSYSGSPIAFRQLNLFDFKDGVAPDGRKRAYKAVVTVVHGKSASSGYGMDDIANLFVSGENTLELLEGDGDFRSPECLALLDEADIVVTNPPFSQFREYIAVLVAHEKKFIVIGNMNAITYKEIFPLLKDNKVWLGYKSLNQDMYFDVPDERKEWLLANKKEGSAYKIIDGVVMGRLASACWFTNLDIKKRHEPLILYKRYKGHEDEYPHYDNYDAINVDKVADIPEDYDGVMGVPITFLDKYCPEQFEILGITDRQNTSGLRTKKYTLADSSKYNDLNARSVLRLADGSYKQVYARLLIKKATHESSERRT